MWNSLLPLPALKRSCALASEPDAALFSLINGGIQYTMFDPCIIKNSTFLKLEAAGGTHISFWQLQLNGFRYLINARGRTSHISRAAVDTIRLNLTQL